MTERKIAQDPECDGSKLRSLIGRIGQYSDTGTLEDYIELFAEDAVWGMSGGQTLSGREAILSAARQRRKDKITGPDSDSMHVVTMSIIDVDGAQAKAQSIFQFYTQISHAPLLVAMGLYHDTFQKTGAEWKLESRMIDLKTR